MNVKLRWSGAALLLLLFALGGCASMEELLPGKARMLPLTPIHDQPTGVHRPGSFVWHDLLTPDPEGSRTFYAALFGWRFQERDGYIEIRNGRRKIGGMVKMDPGEEGWRPAIWLASLSVSDVDQAAAYVERAGGRVVKGPMAMPGLGRGALIADPAGAPLVLLRAEGGDPPAVKAAIGDWLWNETWTRDLQDSLGFYLELGEYDAFIQDQDYAILLRDGKWMAGIRMVEQERYPRQWIPVVRVADPAALLKRVEELGGMVWLRPEESDRGDTALISDNRGALLILQRWEMDGEEGAR